MANMNTVKNAVSGFFKDIKASPNVRSVIDVIDELIAAKKPVPQELIDAAEKDGARNTAEYARRHNAGGDPKDIALPAGEATKKAKQPSEKTPQGRGFTEQDDEKYFKDVENKYKQNTNTGINEARQEYDIPTNKSETKPPKLVTDLTNKGGSPVDAKSNKTSTSSAPVKNTSPTAELDAKIESIENSLANSTDDREISSLTKQRNALLDQRKAAAATKAPAPTTETKPAPAPVASTPASATETADSTKSMRQIILENIEKAKASNDKKAESLAQKRLKDFDKSAASLQQRRQDLEKQPHKKLPKIRLKKQKHFQLCKSNFKQIIKILQHLETRRMFIYHRAV